MLKNKKIKKIIEKESKPHKSFDVFCEENNIGLESQVQTHHSKVGSITKIFVPLLACVLVMCAIIPIAFFKGDNPSIGNGKKYGAQDVVETPISIEDVIINESILLFDYSKAEQIKAIKKITPIENSNLTLSYVFDDVIFGFYVDNQLFAYKFDFRIRCYKNYNFLEEDLFSEVSQSFSYNDIEFHYNILTNDDSISYISFVKKEFEYYIILSDFEDMTEINTENVNRFIMNLF